MARGLCCARLAAQPSENATFSPGSAAFTDSVTVQLSGAAAGQVIRYVVATGPDAADAPVSGSSSLYSEPITISASSLIRAAVFANAEATAPSRITHGYYVRLAEDVRAFRTQLPVLVMDVLGIGPLVKDEIDHPSWRYGFSPNQSGGVFSAAPAFATPIEATVRGSSSAEFPKKGYNIRGRDPAGRSRAFPIFDLSAYERWSRRGPSIPRSSTTPLSMSSPTALAVGRPARSWWKFS